MDVRIDDILAGAARAVPGGLAATFGDERVTFAELDARINQAAHRLAAAGVRPGDRVVWWGPTCLEALVAGYGVIRAGATLAPLNPASTEAEAKFAVEYLRPRLVVTGPGEAPVVEVAAAAGGVAILRADDAWASGASTTPPPRVGTSEQTAAVFLTSGSTGEAKAALLSHRAAWLRAVIRDRDGVDARAGGEVVMFGFFHMAGWWMVEHAWALGRPVHLVTRASPDELLGGVERWGATTLYCIPAVWERILEDRGTYDTSSLREVLTGTSRVDLELVDALKARFPGTSTSVAYGSTEIGRGSVLGDRDLYRKPGSVGPPHPSVEARVDDDGQLLLRGPTLFSGYLDRPQATAAAIDPDGWFHTGDLGTIDDDGYLSITGRRSDVIRSGGEWVAPPEVEAAVASHPAVAEVGIVGVPDRSWGEVVCAAVVVRPGASAPTTEELRAHLAGRLSPAKHPRLVVTVEQLPHTDATGQIRRAELREEILRRIDV